MRITVVAVMVVVAAIEMVEVMMVIVKTDKYK